jgi:deoxyribodipyrimidine photo-lyase
MLNIFIHHRDLRYNDNTTMINQFKNEKNITPIFIFDPIQIDSNINKYFSNGLVQFMIESLIEYDKLLKEKNGKLYYYYGSTIDVIEYINKHIGINSIGFNYEYSIFGKKRDEEIKKYCNLNNIKIYCKEDILLYDIIDGQTLNPNNNKPYLVFTPYYKYLTTKLKVREINKFTKYKFYKNDKLTKIKYSFNDLHSLYIKNEYLNVNGGRSKGLNILKKLKDYKDYKKMRDQLIYKTTYLSAYINLNVISIREVYYALLQVKNHDIIRELIFREYYHTIIYYFPYVSKLNFYEKFDKIIWENDSKLFHAWCNGKTGYPIIDAGIMQLLTTNYLHNRLRMLEASFLIKNLKIDWRKGEQFFAQQLVDYNIYNNWGGWTNIADCAPSSQSYFRVFSPEAHSRKYDKNCEYIKKWLPQLKDVPNEDIHSWERNYKKYLNNGIKYYLPIVDFKKSRDEFLKFYKKYI